MSVAVSPDGKTVVTGGNTEFTARHWELNTAKPIGAPMQHPDRVNSVAFSPDGKTLLTGCADGTARLWSVTDRRPETPLTHSQSSLDAAAFSRDGKRVATSALWSGWVRL